MLSIITQQHIKELRHIFFYTSFSTLLKLFWSHVSEVERFQYKRRHALSAFRGVISFRASHFRDKSCAFWVRRKNLYAVYYDNQLLKIIMNSEVIGLLWSDNHHLNKFKYCFLTLHCHASKFISMIVDKMWRGKKENLTERLRKSLETHHICDPISACQLMHEHQTVWQAKDINRLQERNEKWERRGKGRLRGKQWVKVARNWWGGKEEA